MTAVEQAREKLRYYREAPDGAVQFVIDQFGVQPDEWQRDALIKYQSGRMPRLAMRASKGPGKTGVLAWIGWHFIAVHPYANAAATSITADNLKDGLWKELAKWQRKSAFLTREFVWTKERVFHKDHPGDWWLSARTWSKSADTQQQANTLAGLHADYMLFLLDETGAMPRAIMATAEAALASGIKCRIVQAGNPTNLEGPLYDAETTEAHLWEHVHVSGDPDDPKRSPRVSIEWAKQQIEKYGKDSPWVLVNVYGRFPPASLNALLGPDDVRDAMNRHLRVDQYTWAQRRIGCDVARFGDDLTVLFPRQGLAAFRPVPMSHPRNSPVSVDIANRVILAKTRFRSEMEFFDDTVGWAHGAIDVMRAAGHSPVPIAFEAKSPDPRYFNMRAYMWLKMAEWVKGGGALPNVPELIGELTVPTYMFHNGKFQIEPKDDIKERLGRSPNYADALALTFAIPDMPGDGMDPALRLLIHGNGNRARMDFDPLADRETAAAVMDFDPLRDGI